MPTVTEVTVKPSGGDYTSLNAAEAGEQADLVAADVQLDIACFAMDDTTSVSINGWTTDATRFLRIYCPSGEGHSGVWTTSKYRRRSSTGFGSGLTIDEDFVRFEGLQFYQPSGSYVSILRTNTISNPSSDIRIDRCLFNGIGATYSSGVMLLGTGKVHLKSSIAYGGNSAIISAIGTSGSEVNADNCTFVDAGTYTVVRTSGTTVVTFRNCYSGGNGTGIFNGIVACTACMHDTADSISGSTGSIAYDTSNFTNVTGGSEDLSLVSGSDLIDAGTDLSSDFTLDITGTAFSGTWEIGAFNFASGGGVSVEVPAASLTLTTFAPTVLTPRTVTVPKIDLTTTGFAPTVPTPRLVTVPVVNLTTALFAPTVSTPQTITVPVVNLTTDTFPPEITVSGNREVVVPTASLVLTTFAPVIGYDQTITIPPASLTLTTFAPDIFTPVLVTPGVVNLTTSLFAPTVTADQNIVITPGTLALILTTYAPTVTGSIPILDSADFQYTAPHMLLDFTPYEGLLDYTSP